MSAYEPDDYELDSAFLYRKPSISRKIYRSHAEYTAAERAAKHSKELAAIRRSPPAHSPESPLMAAPLISGVSHTARDHPEWDQRITSVDLLDLGAIGDLPAPRTISTRTKNPIARRQSQGTRDRVSIGHARFSRTRFNGEDSDDSISSVSTDETNDQTSNAAMEPFNRRRVRSSDLQDIIAMSPREDVAAFMALDRRSASSELGIAPQRRSPPPGTRRHKGSLTDNEGAADVEYPSSARYDRPKYFDSSVKRANFSSSKTPTQRSVSIAVPPLNVRSDASVPFPSSSTDENLTAPSSTTLQRSESSSGAATGYEINRSSKPTKHTRVSSSESTSSEDSKVPVMASPRDAELVTELRNGHEVVIAGTEAQLLNHFIYHVQDSASIRQFILAKGSFTTSLRMLALLTPVFEASDPELTAADLAQLQIRTINFLKKWITLLPEDFEEPETRDALDAFLHHLLSLEMNSWSLLITNTWSTAEAALKKRRNAIRGRDLPDEVKTSKTELPPKVAKLEALYLPDTNGTSVETPRAWTAFELFDLSAEELAKQLTLLDQRKFAKVQLYELLGQRWERPADSPHVDAMNKHFNKISRWAGSVVLKEYTPKKRAKVIQYLINVADQMVQIRNFFGATAIAMGLSQTAISRLNATWEKLSSGASDKWKRLSGLVNPVGNFRLLRSLQDQRAHGPLILAPTVLFRDLFFIQEGNEDYYNETSNVLNFEKIMLYGKVLDLFQQAKATPFTYRPIKVVQKYISHSFCLSDDEMMRVSQTFESSHK